MSQRLSNRNAMPAPRVRRQKERVGIAVSAFTFFAALAVLGWFSLSGFSLGAGDDGLTVRERLAAFEAAAGREPASARAQAQPVFADEQEGALLGDYGDPTSEMFGEREGGWGASQ